MTKKKKTLGKKTKTIKVVEPKENDDLDITGFKPITHPRTKKQIKEKAVARANSAAIESNLDVDLETLEDVPLPFNLRMTSELEIEDWLVNNLTLNNGEYYIEHKQGSNVFGIRKEPDTESNNSELVLNNIPINTEDFANIPLLFDLNKTLESEIEEWIRNNIPLNSKEEYYIEYKKGSNLFKCLNVPLLFDLDETSELEIENWIVKSIRYWITKNAPTGRYYIGHVDGSNLFIIRKE